MGQNDPNSYKMSQDLSKIAIIHLNKCPAVPFCCRSDAKNVVQQKKHGQLNNKSIATKKTHAEYALSLFGQGLNKLSMSSFSSSVSLNGSG